MSLQILLDNTAVAWSEFVDCLARFERLTRAEPAFAYIRTSTVLRHETQALCRHLGIEEYTYTLEPDEQAPPALSGQGASAWKEIDRSVACSSPRD